MSYLKFCSLLFKKNKLKQVKKQQQHAQFVLSSLLSNDLQIIDISDPIYEQDKQFMLDNAQANQKGVLPPQFFNENDYCGNYESFAISIENDELFQFLKLAEKKQKVNQAVNEL